MIPLSLRTSESEHKYQLDKQSGKTTPLKDVPSITDYKYWRLINNDYGSDMVYKTSHMLITKRKVGCWQHLNQDEIDELWFLIDKVEKDAIYDVIQLNPPKRRSVPDHFHIHLQIYHDSREDFKL